MEVIAIVVISVLWVMLSHPAPAAPVRRLKPALVRVNPVTNRPRSLRRLRVPYDD